MKKSKLVTLRPCYLCQWDEACTVSPSRWWMCMPCYQALCVHANSNGYDCVVKLYTTIYQAGQVRKDWNMDRAYRFRAFLETLPKSKQDTRRISRILDEVDRESVELNEHYFIIDKGGHLVTPSLIMQKEKESELRQQGSTKLRERGRDHGTSGIGQKLSGRLAKAKKVSLRSNLKN